LEGLLAPGEGSIPTDVFTQVQRPDLDILDRLVHVRHRIALVKLNCPSGTDAIKAEEHKALKYADLRIALHNERWNCSLYMIKVGAHGHILKPVKDCLRSLFRAQVPPAIAQMIKHISWISLACMFSIFQARNEAVWFSIHLVTRHIDGVPAEE
jgi:hypothetical protein